MPATPTAPPAPASALSAVPSPSPSTGDVLDRANAGDMEAQYQVGMSMIRMAGRTDDPSKKSETLQLARNFLTSAAEKGHVAAQQELAKLAPPPSETPPHQQQSSSQLDSDSASVTPERALRAQLQADIQQRLKDADAGRDAVHNRRVAKMEQELLKRNHITVDDYRDAWLNIGK